MNRQPIKASQPMTHCESQFSLSTCNPNQYPKKLNPGVIVSETKGVAVVAIMFNALDTI